MRNYSPGALATVAVCKSAPTSHMPISESSIYLIESNHMQLIL